MGELKQGSDPHTRQLSESEEKHLRLSVKQLICGSLNGMRIRQTLSQPSGWELEFRDSGAIPGQGLLLTAERQIGGM